MKQVGVLALLIAGVCAGAVLGLELGSAEGAKPVVQPEMLSERLDTEDPYLAALRKSQAENEALRAELGIARVALEDRQLEGEALLERLERLKAEGAARMEATGERSAKMEARSAEIEARIAELEAQLEDERLHRLNMVEEAIERRGLVERSPDAPVVAGGGKVVDGGPVTSPYRVTADGNSGADTLIKVMIFHGLRDVNLIKKATDKD